MKSLYKSIILLGITVFILNVSFAQTYWLDGATNLQTYTTCSAILFDNGGPSGDYTNGQDYEITFQTNSGSCIRAVIQEYDIENNYDYLYFYDGPSSASPQIGARVTGWPMMPPTTIDERGNAYYAQSGYITIRFTSDGATVRGGFELKIDCPENCVSPSCQGTLPAGDSCDVSTPICDFNGYCGNTSTAYPTDHEEIDYYDMGIFCGGINNNSWLSFVADSTTAILDVWVENCQGSSGGTGPIYGIQLQVYESDCSYGNFTPKSNCWSPAKEVNGQIVATGLTVGNTYLLMIDGFASDNCEYVFAASSGVIVADAGNDQTICEGENVTLTASGGTSITWTSNPVDPSLSGQENNMSINIFPSQTTTYTASVSGSNPNCPGTADVVVFVNAADAWFTGLDNEYCTDGTPVVLTGNYTGGIFSGSGISGSSFDPSAVSPGTYDITYTYNYSVVTAFFDDMDLWPDPGWIHGSYVGTSSWIHGSPKGGDGQNSNSYSNSDPIIDHTSNTDNKAWGQGLSDTDGDGLGGYYDSSNEWLRSPAIDCSSLSNTVLSFWRYANFEPNWDTAYVEISINGTTWSDMGEALYPQDDQWTQRIINISSWADGQSTVYIRFRSFSDNLQTYSGWNIDDFSITGVQSGGACVSTDVQTTNINALPIVSAGSNATICAGQTYTLNGSVTGGVSTGTWGSSGSGSFDNTGLLSATYTPSANDITNGNITLTLTSGDPSGPCGQVFDEMALTIDPLDDASFSYSSGTFCSTATDPLPDYIATGGGTFSSTPAGLVINSSTGEIDLSASTINVTYTITYNVNINCQNSSTFNITITSGFDAEFDYNEPFCQGGTNPLPTHTTGSNGNYSVLPAGLLFVNSGTGEIDLTNSTPGTYTITNIIAASGGCSEAIHSVSNIIIEQQATVDAGTDATICAGDNYTLTGSFGGSAGSATWSTSGTGGFTGTEYTPSLNDITTGNVTLTFTTDNPTGPCDAVSDFMILTIEPTPTVDAGIDETICEGDDFQLAGTYGGSANSATWSTAGTGIFDSGYYTPSTDDITAGSVILTYTTDDPPGVCGSVSDSITLVIDEAPVVDAGLNISICEGDDIVLSASIGGSTSSIIWTTSGSGSFTNPNLTNTTYTPSSGDVILGNIIITITSNDPTGPCDATIDSLLLKINSLPVLSVNTDSSSCNLSYGAIYITPVGGAEPYSYSWSQGSSTDSSLTSISSGIYSVTVTDDFGCEVDTTVSIYDIGAGTLSFINIADVKCYGESTGSAVVVINGGTPEYNYFWSDSSMSDTLTNVSAGIYFVTVTDANGCIVFNNVIISQPTSVLDINSTVTDVTCFGENNGFIISQAFGGVSPYNYSWSISQNDSIITSLYLGYYIITVTDNNDCKAIDTMFVSEPSKIVAGSSFITPTCSGSSDGSITISASGGIGPYSYIWDVSTEQTDTVISDLPNGIYNVSITDANNCIVSYNFMLESTGGPCLFIPNLFTPNNDGHNDVWRILGAEHYPEMTIEIFNRWGNVIFQSSGYNQPWDGSFNGKQVPFGGYVYIIDLKDGNEPLNGIVTIKR